MRVYRINPRRFLFTWIMSFAIYAKMGKNIEYYGKEWEIRKMNSNGFVKLLEDYKTCPWHATLQ